MFLVACDEPSSEEHVERARSYLEKGDIQASIIESKNAVQADPSNAAARLLLGQSYLKAVQLENAEKEFLRARELGIDPKTAVDSLATVWLMQSRPELVLGEFFPEDGQPPDQRTSIHLARAIAYYYLGDFEKADEQFRLARDIDPDNLHALVGLSSVALEEGDLAAAEAALASANLLGAENLSVLALTGDLNFRQGDFDSAEAAYRAMLQQRPDGIGARLALAQVEMVQGELDEAVNNIEQVLNRVPRHTGANFLRAAIALKNGNVQTAKLHSEHVLQVKPDHRQSLLIAGVTSLRLDQLEQAHRYLSAFLAQVPEHQVATGLLAQAQARLERLERYPAVLTKLLDSSADDQLLLTVRDPAIKWQSRLKVGGQLWVALEGGSGGAELDPCRSDLAETGPSEVLPAPSQALPWWGSLADDDCAMAAEKWLGQALEEHRYAFVPNALLAQLWLRSRRFGQVVRAVEGLLLDDPQRLSLLALQGLAEAGRGEDAKARDIFRRLTEARPNAAEARFLLAMTYPILSDGPGRRVQLEEALSRRPNFIEAELDLIRLRALDGQIQGASEQARALAANNPGNAATHELQGTLALISGDYPTAIAAMEAALLAEFSGVRALKLALAHERGGDPTEALASLEDWLQSHPTDVDLRLSLANRYLSAGRTAAARSHYRKALFLVPYNVVVLNNLAWTELLLGNASIAADLAERAYQLAPDDPRVLDTFGFALTETDDLDRGVALLRRAVKRAPEDAQARYHLARALVQTGAREEAKEILKGLLVQQAEFPEREDAERLLNTL